MSNLNNFYKELKTPQNGRYTDWPYLSDGPRLVRTAGPINFVVQFARDRGHLRLKMEEAENYVSITPSRTKKGIKLDPPDLTFNIDCGAEEFAKGGFDKDRMTIEGDLEEVNLNDVINVFRHFEGSIQSINSRRRSIVA